MSQLSFTTECRKVSSGSLSSLNKSVLLPPTPLMFSDIRLTVGSYFHTAVAVQEKTLVRWGQRIHLTYKVSFSFFSLYFFFSIMLPTAKQPQEKVFAACEVFRGWSYLGKVQPKTMVALWGDRWPHTGNLSQSERWALNIIDIMTPKMNSLYLYLL